MNPYEYENSEHSVKEVVNNVNDPDKLKRVIGYIEDTEEQMINPDDEGARSIFEFTRPQHKYPPSNLKK